EGLPFGAIDKNLRPRFGIDLHGDVEGDHRLRCFIAVDDVRQESTHVAMTIFERVRSRRQLERNRRGSDIRVIPEDVDGSGRTDREYSFCRNRVDGRLCSWTWRSGRS